MKNIFYFPLFLFLLLASIINNASACITLNHVLKKTFITKLGSKSVGCLTELKPDKEKNLACTKIKMAALVASGPEVGVSIYEAIAATRLLRKSKYADKAYIGKSADEIRLALAKKDLQGFNEAWEFVRTHPRGAEAWEMIRIAIGNNNDYTQFARDLKTLEKVVDMISEGSAFRVKFPGNWQSKIEEALFRNKHLNCSTCNGTFNRGPNMDEFLRDFEFINLHFVETTDLGTRLHAWSKRKYLNGNDIHIDHGNLSEVHQTLNFIRKRNLKETHINKMDGVFFDDLATSKKFDLELVDGPPRFIELKNKDFGGMQNLPSSDIDQVLSSTGAFSKIDNIDDYNWVAYLRRFGENADPSDAVTVLKGMWKDAIDARKTEVFDLIWESQNNLKIDLFGNRTRSAAESYFNQLIYGAENNKLYSFIKSE